MKQYIIKPNYNQVQKKRQPIGCQKRCGKMVTISISQAVFWYHFQRILLRIHWNEYNPISQKVILFEEYLTRLLLVQFSDQTANCLHSDAVHHMKSIYSLLKGLCKNYITYSSKNQFLANNHFLTTCTSSNEFYWNANKFFNSF